MITLITFLSYILVSFGITEMILFFNGPFDIIDKFRNLMHAFHPKLGELFTCPACLSTWVGILFSIINYLIIPIPITPFNIILGSTGMWWFIIPFDAFLTMGSTWTLYQLDEYLEKNAKEYDD